MMNNPLAVALMTLLALPAYASDTAKRTPPLATRASQLINSLEINLVEAVQQHNLEAVKKILAEDFELRSATSGADPIPRDEAIKRAFASPAFPSRIDQLATHEYGDVVIVSFWWKLGVPKNGMLAQQVFVVDTWKQNDGNWQMVARYAAPVASTPPGSAVPGAYVAAQAAVVKKK